MVYDDNNLDEELLTIKFSHLLNDSNTGLPTLISKIDVVRDMLEQYGELGLLSIDLDAYAEIEATCGWKQFDNIILRLSEILYEFSSVQMPNQSLLIIRDRDDPDFLIFFSPSSSSGVDRFSIYDQIEAAARELFDYLESKSWGAGANYRNSLKCHVGFSRIVYNPVMRTERSIFYGLAEAKRRVGEEARAEVYRRREILRGIVTRQEINTRYQPIVDIRNQHILGYEALSFGPIGTEFTNPEMLFAWARETELVIPLDRVCRHRAVANCCGWLGDETLFVNTNPVSLEDTEFFSQELIGCMKKSNVKPSQIVIEITERSAIQNFATFSEVLDRFRKEGYRFAVDDAGAGYASLHTIAEVRPEFLKFDINMVRNIDRDLIKQELLSVVMDFAERINAKVVAEGIETDGEFRVLKSFGVHLGQGYYLAKPIPATSSEPPVFEIPDI